MPNVLLPYLTLCNFFHIKQRFLCLSDVQSGLKHCKHFKILVFLDKLKYMGSSTGHYVSHLSEVSKTNKVTLAEDIFNQHGVLVIKKGTEVDLVFAKKIAKHKLNKPIEQSIALSSPINQRTSLNNFNRYMEEMKISDTMRQSGFYNYAQEFFHLITLYPLVAQKLTVLEQRLPEVFSRSLMMSVMAVGLCKELKLPMETMENVFLANLISDVGLLHIDPQILNKEGQYNQGEFKMMQGHVVIARHFADMVPNFPKKIGRAVLEHHERADGFGYPFGRKISELCIEGQVLAVVDKVNAIYRKLVKDGPHSWTSVIAVMQVPSTAHAQDVYKAIMRLLRGFALEYEVAHSAVQFTQLVKVCIEKRERLNLWFKEFARIYIDHKELMNDSNDFQPLALLHQLEHTVVDSGVLNMAQNTWLLRLKDKVTKKDYREIEEFALVLNEVEYQCFFVMRKFESAQNELVSRLNSTELPSLYYNGLMNILAPDEK
jgi:HD-GYP domain-containing protein (c-di-GMP phosphodiesterase class II)